MSRQRMPTPSPHAGEVGVRTRSVRAPGEGPGDAVILSGVGVRCPSPGRSLWNNEVLSNLEGVLTVLSAELERRR